MKIEELVAMGLLLVILGFVLSMGATVTSDMQETICNDNGTWGVYNDSASASPYGGYTACCYSINSSVSTKCDTWQTSYELNASQESLKGVDELASWQDTLALVIIFGVIIALLIGFVFRGAISSGTRA